MRGFGWVIFASMLLMAPACAQRAAVAPLGHVSGPQALRVRLRQEPYAIRFDLGGARYRVADGERLLAETREATVTFNRSLAGTLHRAGYQVTESGPCDVHVVRELYFDAEPRERRHGNISLGDIVRVVFHVYDTTGGEIDRFEFGPPETPETPDGVAVDLVNAMLRSPKVASYAATRKSSMPSDMPAAD
ncbi:hypothetical protein BH11MYX4_BH11MYX4_42570 [soil metagenome]